ncbi:hypothetical protein GUJ93_ZPchr0012g21874 [Zizania palustris]|uniref:Uncharacterized protein n=1 Tax=Zizania palustris TaxID=103762 RepID=A0A8J5WS32_ZIZPA|nr:hypothetical protein GUJ93_ZPchr0012g21874 [Zizania palustris]
MSLRVLLAWLLVAVLLLGSSTCSSSRPIADGVGSAAAGGAHGNGEDNIAAAAPRRSLGSRATSPPSPLPNKTRSWAMPAPPPPKL